MQIRFTKMQGAGNDYIYVDAIDNPFPIAQAPALARQWSERNFGIGADGLILLLRGEQHPLRMLMWNADGSRGAMCGNGLRCLAVLARNTGHATTEAFTVETDAGPRRVKVLDDQTVRAELGEVRCEAAERADLLGEQLEFHRGDAGNPHAVVFVADVERCDVPRLGAAMQARRDLFPDSVNVEFVEVLAADRLRQRTYERGSGETLACGTGAGVAALAARQSGRCSGHSVLVHLRGGDLRVHLDSPALAIEGPAHTVFTGEVWIPD